MSNDQDKKADDQLPLGSEPPTQPGVVGGASNRLPTGSPDDIDEALAWLEQLATKQGISVDELTSRYPSAIELSFPELSLSQSDELPEWLKEEPPARRLREFPSSAGETAALDDIPSWLLSDAPPATPAQDKESAELSDELDSRLDWLAEMGKKDELAEMPTVRWRPEDAGLADSGIPSSADLNALADPKTGLPSSPDLADLRHTGPEDLDEAMAWLEELATSQETPLQELPSVADRILASRLMAESGLDMDDLPRDTLEGHDVHEDEPLFASTFSDEAFNEPDAEPVEISNFPDNLDDAMDYLDKLAAARQQKEPAITEEPATTEAAEEEAYTVAELMAVDLPTEDEATEIEGMAEETAVESVDIEEPATTEAAEEETPAVAEMTVVDLPTEEEATVEIEAMAEETAAESVGIEEPVTTEAAEEEMPTVAEMTVVDLPTEEEATVEIEAMAEETAVESPDEVDTFLAEILEFAHEETDSVATVDVVDETAAADMISTQDEQEAPAPTTTELAPTIEEPEEAPEPEFRMEGEQEAYQEVGRFDEEDLEAVAEVNELEEADDSVLKVGNLLVFTTDRLEESLTKLDQLSLPPGVTLQSLNEELAGRDMEFTNGHGADLNSTLLWIEQQLELEALPAEAEQPMAELPATPKVYEEPDELLLSVADLDDELVAELTADMPEDPDQALEWLLGLADEVESDPVDMEEDDEDDPETQDSATGETTGFASPSIEDIDIYDMPEPLSPEESLVDEQEEELAEYEPHSAELEAPVPSLPDLSAEVLPEMPDDPDETIAWIERLAALEAQENAIMVGQQVTDDFDSDFDDEVGDEFSQVTSPEEEEEADYSEYEVESSLIIEAAEEAPPAEEASDEPATVEQAEQPEPESTATQPQPEPAARRPHERWLEQLQPPPWASKK